MPRIPRVPELVAKHLEGLRAKLAPEGSVRLRRDHLARLLRFCEAHEVASVPELVRQLPGYPEWLAGILDGRGKPMSPANQRQHLIACRAFFWWLRREGCLPGEGIPAIDVSRKDQRLPRHPLTEPELERLLALPDVATPRGLRDRALLEVLYSTGIRRSELLGLRPYDIDRGRGLVTVRCGKGRKDRVVPIGERALSWLDRYLASRAAEAARATEDEALFPLDTGSLTWIVHRWLRAAGIRAGNCHLFRHTAASHMLEHGADIRYIQAMLGHRRLTTTQIYAHVTIDELRRVHKATHPAEIAATAEPYDEDRG